MDNDHMECAQGQKYLFYSFGTFYSFLIIYTLGEDFDYQVRLEFIDWKSKLGEGGFGSVFLAYDKIV